MMIMMLVVMVSCVSAVDYYVDCNNGDNSNPGTRNSPWEYPPGSVNDGGNNIGNGDTLYFRPGSDCTGSGKWEILNSDYGIPLGAGDSVNILIDDTWGSGDVEFGDEVEVQRDYVNMQGSFNNKFHFYGLTGAFDVRGSDYSNFAWIDLGGQSTPVDTWCMIISDADYTNFSDMDIGYCNANSNDAFSSDSNIGVGANWAGGSGATNLRFTRVHSHHCLTLRGGSRCDGWNGWGVTDSVWDHCDAYNNLRRGFDFGEHGGAYTDDVKFVGCRAWENGDIGDSNAAGFWMSSAGDYYIINSISRDQNIGIGTYDSSTIYIYHCLLENNRFSVHIEPNSDVTIRNTISYERNYAGHAFIKTYVESGISLDSDYNSWYGSSSNYIKVAHWGGTNYPFSNLIGWQSAGNSFGPQDTNHVGGYSPTLGWADQINHDFSIVNPSSDLIDNGDSSLSSPSEVLYDFDGNLRDGQPDIGAYEFQGTCIGFTQINATHREACTCSQSDVQATIDASSDGDTVLVPAGSCVWSSGVILSNNITLQGEGIGNTTISLGGITAVDIGISGSRVTGFEFIFSSSGGEGVSVSHTGWRVDHCKFDFRPAGAKGIGISFSNRNLYYPQYSISGLVDNCEFYDARNLVNGPAYGRHANGYRYHSTPLDLGGESAIYFEDNYFNLAQFGNLMDASRSGAYVFRYNTVDKTGSGGSVVEAHSLQSDQERATKKWEIYRNDINHGSYETMFLRGGTGVVFQNTVTGSGNQRVRFDNVRDTSSVGISGLCDGSNPNWDSNENGGWLCRDQVGSGSDQVAWSGTFPLPSQDKFPAYVWNNSQGFTTSTSGNVQENRDFYFDGSGGVGIGTFSEMQAISTCTENVGFWVTDRGSWNSLGEDGQLFKCDDSNNWVFYYEPLEYPHPLRTGGAPGPSCTHQADTSGDCIIDRNELNNYISDWKGNPSITLAQVIDSIGKWKAGYY